MLVILARPWSLWSSTAHFEQKLPQTTGTMCLLSALSALGNLAFNRQQCSTVKRLLSQTQSLSTFEFWRNWILSSSESSSRRSGQLCKESSLRLMFLYLQNLLIIHFTKKLALQRKRIVHPLHWEQKVESQRWKVIAQRCTSPFTSRTCGCRIL